MVSDKILVVQAHELMGETLTERGTLDDRVLDQEAQHLGKVRLTGTIETAEPYARLLHVGSKLVEEVGQMLSKTLGEDKAVEFFLHSVLALRIEVDDILDVVVQLDGQNIFDFHSSNA